MRKKKAAAVAKDKQPLHKRYGVFGDPAADDSSEEARRVKRVAEAKWGPIDDSTVIAAAAAAGGGVDLLPALKRCICNVYFEPSYFASPGADAEGFLAGAKAESSSFTQQSTKLANDVFARIDAVIASCEPLSAFHRAMRTELAYRVVAAPAGVAAKSIMDVTANSGQGRMGIPVESQYQLIRLDNTSFTALAVPRSIAQMLSVAHAVYHIVHYLRQAVIDGTTMSMKQQLLNKSPHQVWCILLGPVHATAPLTQWKWPGSAPLVQLVVQLNTVLQTACAWLA